MLSMFHVAARASQILTNYDLTKTDKEKDQWSIIWLMTRPEVSKTEKMTDIQTHRMSVTDTCMLFGTLSL